MSVMSYIIQVLDPTGTLPIGVYGDKNGDPDYDTLIWESEEVPRPTREEFEKAVVRAKAMTYQDSRRSAYPSITDQLDMLFHHGIDGWREVIASIKEQYPKPEVN